MKTKARPRKPRAPRAPRARTTRARSKDIGIWNAVCRNCKTKFRVLDGPKPKTCIICKSKKLDIKAGRANAQERIERDVRFMHAATGFVHMIMGMLGIPIHFPPRFEPPPPPRTRHAMSREEAALFIAGFSETPKDYILDSAEARESAYKRAARSCHPDSGGSHELFVKLQQAKAALS